MASHISRQRDKDVAWSRLRTKERAINSYLVERYVSRCKASDVQAELVRVREATHDLERGGPEVRYVRSILLPADEICFHLFQADQPDHVARALEDAGLEYERLTEVLEVD